MDIGEDREGKRADRWAQVALGVAVATFALAAWRLAPRSTTSADAPASEFSGARARAVLERLAGSGAPHPIGTAEHAAMRERVLAAFRAAGYEPAVETGFACRLGNSCAETHNVIARLAGAKPGKAVLLAAHYDSVAAGPGVSDDLTGVAAILEIARALKAGPPPARGVVFLVDDGEEAGLLGAEAFVKTPLAREIGAVVNLEARGTSGPALMFETQHANTGWISRFARAVPRPVGSSLFVSIYERLPNDTDLTVFDRAGLPGFNFAFIGNGERYHTPLDDLAHASPATLEHLGASAFGLVRDLAAGELPAVNRGADVFFDVLSAFVVRWPSVMTLPLALLALALVGGSAARIWRRRAASVGGTIAAFVTFLAAIAAAAAAAWLFTLLMRIAGGLSIAWPAEPRPLVAALWLLGAGAALATLGSVSRTARPAGVWAGVWLGWALAGVALAVALPGGSFLLIVPALVAGACGLVGRSERPTVGALVPAVVAGLLWFPLAILIFDGLGTPGALILALLVAWAATAFAPVLAVAPCSRRVALTALALAAVAAALVPATTRPSPGAPRRATATYHLDADANAGRFVVAGDRVPHAPGAMSEFARFAPGQPYPWSSTEARAAIAPAPAMPLPAPTLEVLADERTPVGRKLRLRLASPRGAPMVTLHLPATAGVGAARMNGVDMPRDRDGALPLRADWFSIQCLATPAAGVEVEIEVTSTAPLDGYLVDRSLGLPPSGRGLAAARPPAVASEGDALVVSRRVRL